MRITVDIDDAKLEEVCKWTHENKKSPAIAAAIDQFLEQKQRQLFLDRVLSGKTDYAASNAEIEPLSHFDA